MSRRRKIVLCLIACALVAAWLRESGRLKVQWYAASFKSHRHFEGKYHKFRTDEVKATESNGKYDGDGNSDNNADGYSFGFSFPPPEPWKPEGVALADAGLESYLAEVVRARLAEKVLSESPVRISIQRFELAGSYWRPLLKTGSFTYDLTIEDSSGGEWRTNDCALSGRVDFSMKGLSSVRELENMLAEDVAKQVVETMKTFKEYQ